VSTGYRGVNHSTGENNQDAREQPRSQGFSLEGRRGKEKALGTRLAREAMARFNEMGKCNYRVTNARRRLL